MKNISIEKINFYFIALIPLFILTGSLLTNIFIIFIVFFYFMNKLKKKIFKFSMIIILNFY